MKKLVFDVTDANTILDSDSVGAFVRAGTDGDLIDSKTIAASEWLQVASALFDSDGTGITSTGGALDVNIASGSFTIDVTTDGVYDAGTNPTPDTEGLIAHSRAAAPDETNQDFRSTGGGASSDAIVAANVHGLDTNAFGMLFNGTTWDRARGTSGAMHINDGGNSITVDGAVTVSATDLDIRDLAFATDSVDVSGSAVSISGDVNVTQGTSPWVVSATDLDIRNLVFATDKVDVGGSVVALDAGTLAALESITVQNGAGASAVNIQDGGNSITVDGSVTVNDAALANSSMVASQNDVTTVSEALIASPLANRKYVLIRNEGNRKCYLNGGTATATSFPIYPGELMELRAGASAAISIIADGGTQDMRALELA